MKQGVIDIGNSLVKVAVFEQGTLISLSKYSHKELQLKKLIFDEVGTIPTIVSSVVSKKQETEILPHSETFVDFNDLQKPIRNNYQTPETLGQDRLANAVAINHFSEGKPAICIDLGTCLKFDIVENGIYLGGSISPGIRLRYKSLHTFTGKLPLLSQTSKVDLIGTDTNTSIQSGVMNGINAEIRDVVSQYEQRFQDLTIFMTGGDMDKLDLGIKKSIFADSNLTLKGLQLILEHNALKI